MNGIDMLKDDHQRVDKLFKEFEGAGDRAYKTKRDLVDRIVHELRTHSSMEEEVLYPTAQAQVADAKDIVLESEEEHSVVSDLLTELEGMEPEDERFDAKTTVLMENVRHHVEEEENELFPKIEKALGEERVEQLGAEMEAVKQRLVV
ncbi:MAG: hemerythrin domain-containing protein [Actinomycetota bacterium]